MDLSIIIVSYNTKILLRQCIDSIRLFSYGFSYEIIIVDNSSQDGSAEMIRSEYPDISLISNIGNMGFAKANNQGIKIAKGNNILLLNSDTILLNNCLKEILSFVNKRHDVGVVGCKVLNNDKTLQYSSYHRPNLLTEVMFYTKEIINGFWDPINYYRNMKYWNHDTIKIVDTISGCFLWIRKEVFDGVGLLDENFFMYYEDAEFCRRVKSKSKYAICYYPKAGIIHLGGMSTNKLDNNSIRLNYKSALYYFYKCDGVNTAKVFDILCNVIWRIEIIVLSLFKLNKKYYKKITMLKYLCQTEDR